jgi:hypothetical protein
MTACRLLLALLPLALLGARAARADVLEEGYKGISHELRVEGLDRFPDLEFVLFPVTMRGDAAVVTSDRPLPYIKWSTPRLYALPKGTAVTSGVTEDWLKARAVAVSWHEFSQENQVPEERREDRIVTVFRLARVDGKKLVIEGVREELFDRTGALLERRVPAVHETDPDAKRDEGSHELDSPPAPRDQRGSWVPGRLGGGALAVLPLLAFAGLLVTRWRRQGARGAALVLALAVALAAGAGVARADLAPPPREAGPTWLVAGGVAGAAVVGLLAFVVLRRRRA